MSWTSIKNALKLIVGWPCLVLGLLGASIEIPSRNPAGIALAMLVMACGAGLLHSGHQGQLREPRRGAEIPERSAPGTAGPGGARPAGGGSPRGSSGAASLDFMILQAAEERGGALTLAAAVLATGKSVAEIKTALEQLVAAGVAELDVLEGGAYTYRFPGLGPADATSHRG
ncbi:MAG: hypothetical protein HYV63_19380 [Candidatus Schekmanbacteria bacterium]|nr:hypothetical protein [Candidatus Schekmanbacteria bacterium]